MISHQTPEFGKLITSFKTLDMKNLFSESIDWEIEILKFFLEYRIYETLKKTNIVLRLFKNYNVLVTTLFIKKCAKKEREIEYIKFLLTKLSSFLKLLFYIF